jgi:hypothetical protein
MVERNGAKKIAKTAARGYGGRHQATRRQLEALVASGRAHCARCGLPIREGQQWDLGHDDNDRSRYVGPEHRNARDCKFGGNRATAGRRRALPARWSRIWHSEPERGTELREDGEWLVYASNGRWEPVDSWRGA